jgi:hypothetical protein
MSQEDPMTIEPGTPIVEPPVVEPVPEKKRSKTWLIILIVVLVLCCLSVAAIAAVYMWVWPAVKGYFGYALLPLLTV